MGTPVDLYIYPGMPFQFQVLTKITMTPLGPTDTIPAGALTVPPSASPLAPVAHLAAAEVMANLKQTTDIAAKALSESAAAQEVIYNASAPIFTISPTGQTSGPK